jgi:hypothetical protein
MSLLCIGILGLTATSALAEADSKGANVYKIDVMTQNLYVGADLMRVYAGAPCGPLQSIYEIHETVQATNFPERAEAIADRVMRQKPHVIGLQEVALIRSQFPSDGAIIIDFQAGTFRFMPNADDVVYDYLQILLDALAARGLDYVEVEGATSWNADIEFPMASFDGDCNFTSFPMDLRQTDRDVILVRRDLPTANAANGNYSLNLPVTMDVGEPLPLSIEFTRGFGQVDVTVGKDTFRVVNTHLEVGDDADPGSPINFVQFVQAAELIGAATGTPLPLVVMGDFNSSPSVFDPRPAYGMMTGTGYVDLWNVRQGRPDPGFTCCQDELLRNPTSGLFERVDLVFAMLPPGAEPMPIQSRVVGDRDNDKTASGMWSSDHAGVASTLKFKQRR